jgi:hypothetical protein
LHISAPHGDTQPRGCGMSPGSDGDDLALVIRVLRLAPMGTCVDHLPEYSQIPHPWDDAAVGRRVNS